MHWAWTWFTIVTSLALPVHLIAWMSARARVRMLREIWRPGIARMQGRDRDVPRTTEPGYVTLHPLDVLQKHGAPVSDRDVDFARWYSKGSFSLGLATVPFRLGALLCAGILLPVALTGWSPSQAVAITVTIAISATLFCGWLFWPE